MCTHHPVHEAVLPDRKLSETPLLLQAVDDHMQGLWQRSFLCIACPCHPSSSPLHGAALSCAAAVAAFTGMDDGSAAAPAAGPTLKQPTPFTPWGQYSAAGKQSKPKTIHIKQQQPPPVEYKTPKALLQQHCQKVNLQPPRFERITQPAGVDAAAAAAGAAVAAAAAGQRGQYRYKVILAPAAPAGGKGGASAAAGGSKRFNRVITGPKTYQLFADEDGWASVQDAQNAAAARALFALHKQAVAAAASGKSSSSSSSSQLRQMQAVYQQLERQWAGLWDAWWGLEVSGGQGSGAGVEEVLAAEQEQQRDEFLR
jgi:hypothetical protein